MDSEAGIVDYSLWRDGQRLGRLRISFPVANNESAIFGMLEVDEAFTDIEEITQVMPPMSPINTVFQSIGGSAPERVVLRELSKEEARGVAPDRVLIMRDAAGASVPFKFLMIHRMPGLTDPRGKVFEVCRSRGIVPSEWVVSAH